MKQNAVTFACSECKQKMVISHLVFHENELYMVGHCATCKDAQVNFKLDALIANLMGRVLLNQQSRMTMQ